jgi:hypothetical protein
MPKSIESDIESDVESAEVVEEKKPISPFSKRKSKKRVEIKRRTESMKLKSHASSVSLLGTKKHVVIGEYDISIPEEKVPLVGVLVSAIVLFCAIFVDNIISNKYRYAIILCVVAFIAAILSIFIPKQRAVTLNYFLFLITWVGACLLTFGDGPYVEPSNGYFGAWFLAIFSGAATDPPGDLSRRIFDAKVHLASSSIVVLTSLVESLDTMSSRNEDEKYETEISIGLVVTVLALLTMLYFALCKACCPFFFKCFTGEKLQAYVYILIALLWCIATALVTFRGPFNTVASGNGYFASWFSSILGVRLAWIAWQIRDDDDDDGDDEEETEEK